MPSKVYHRKKSDMRGEKPRYYLPQNTCNQNLVCSVQTVPNTVQSVSNMCTVQTVPNTVQSVSNMCTVQTVPNTVQSVPNMCTVQTVPNTGQSVQNMCTGQTVPNTCTVQTVPNTCSTLSCNFPGVNVPIHKSSSITNCRYSPYYCFNYRNVSLWCEYCMSRRMFPEHYPYDPRFFSNSPPPCSDLYVDGQYAMPPRALCTIPQTCVVQHVAPQNCPVFENHSNSSCSVIDTNF